MNISIPDELRQRMHALDSKVNWSNLATGAFEEVVANAERIASFKSPMKRRIMQTEVDDIPRVERFARREGQEWAARNARMIELRSLAREGHYRSTLFDFLSPTPQA